MAFVVLRYIISPPAKLAAQNCHHDQPSRPFLYISFIDTFCFQVDAQVKLVDTTLGQLMDGLYQHNLHHCVNLMVVSDHG